jgi:hypothetical protein
MPVQLPATLAKSAAGSQRLHAPSLLSSLFLCPSSPHLLFVVFLVTRQGTAAYDVQQRPLVSNSCIAPLAVRSTVDIKYRVTPRAYILYFLRSFDSVRGDCWKRACGVPTRVTRRGPESAYLGKLIYRTSFEGRAWGKRLQGFSTIAGFVLAGQGLELLAPPHHNYSDTFG